MRAVTLAFVTAGVVAAASVVYAKGEAAALVGKDAPEITTSEFLLSDGRTRIADFKGEVLFIECFATW